MSGRSDGPAPAVDLSPAPGTPADAGACAPADAETRAPADVDVLIAGASFAGLAAAQALGRRALLVDPVAVGDGQTSACAAPVRVLELLGAAEAMQERHDELVLHLAGREVRWPLPEPFCTFDYRRFCLAALRASGAEVRRASVQGRCGGVVLTSAGAVRGRVLVDCSGWRAVLAGGRAAAGPGRRPRGIAFGLEAEVPRRFPPGLHFYFGPDLAPDGYAWVFPAGDVSRIGLLSYRGRTNLGAGLDRFLQRLGAPPGPRHGGFLLAGLRPPVVDGVLLAGDAAGQCLPLSGEGIRTAVWAGRACGRLARAVLDGRLSAADAQRRYRAFVAAQRRRYRALLWATLGVLVLPAPLLGALAAWCARPRPLALFMRHYLEVFAGYAAVDAAA
jgi:flavin-dependent dehydrogenase